MNMIYQSKRAHQLASLHDYMTACGREDPRDVAESIDSIGDEAAELMRSEWMIPYSEGWTQIDYQNLIVEWAQDYMS